MVYMLCLSKQYVPPSRTLRFASVLTHSDNKRVSGSVSLRLNPRYARTSDIRPALGVIGGKENKGGGKL